MRSLPPSSFAPEAGFQLAAELAGGRTTLRRQHVGYPFHITRGFYLDRARPDLLTLYLQSASGGLYAGDRLTAEIAVGANAALHLTTQAATVVHDGRDGKSRQLQRIEVGQGAFCAVSSDPYVVFPGADLELESVAVVADDAVLFLADGLAAYDPKRTGRKFKEFCSRVRIVRPDGRLLLRDRGRIDGDAFDRSTPGMMATATVLIIAPAPRLPELESLMRTVDQCGCLCGASEAPNRAGLVMRLLAPDAGALARGLEAAFHAAAKAALGAELAKRRK